MHPEFGFHDDFPSISRRSFDFAWILVEIWFKTDWSTAALRQRDIYHGILTFSEKRNAPQRHDALFVFFMNLTVPIFHSPTGTAESG